MIRDSYINDKALWMRWAAIRKYMTQTQGLALADNRGVLCVVKHQCYIAKNSTKMRLKSHIDWCHYTPKGLAQAIDADQVAQYYEQMLCDPRSDPNQWRHRDEEQDIKAFYAARAGRASLI